MERKRILFAVNTPPSVLDLRKSLVTAGYEVKIVDNGSAALTLCREFRPHLVCAEQELSKIDGHHLFRELKAQSATKNIAFVLLSKHRSVEERVHSINLGVDDYITQPFNIDEVLIRFEIIMREVETFEAIPKNDSKGFSGKLVDLNFVELLQTLEIGEKSGTIKLQSNHREAIVFLKSGQVLDVTLNDLSPKEALFRIFTWNDGAFRVDFKPIEQQKAIEESTQELISQGFKYLDVWNKISKSLPSLQTTIEAGPKSAPGNLTGEERAMMSLITEKIPLIDLIEESDFDDLMALKILANLYNKGAIVEVPLEEIQNNDKGSVNTSSSGNEISDLIANFLSPNGDDRIKIERRKKEDRRVSPRRWTDFVKERNQIHLNKSELLMIREKLSNDKTQKKLIKNLSQC